MRGFQSSRLHLSINGEPQSVDEGEIASMPDTAANVAFLYAALRDDILRGTSTAPGFDHAVRGASLIEDATRHNRGERQRGGKAVIPFPAWGCLTPTAKARPGRATQSRRCSIGECRRL
jgi:hypothetical protein